MQEETTPARTVKRIHLSFPPDAFDALKAEAAKTGAPLSEIVRRAVSAYLANNNIGAGHG
jgi:hypothetical protein